MTLWSLPLGPARRRDRAVWRRDFGPGAAMVIALVEEFRRAIAAADRYEQLRRRTRAGGDPALDNARRIHREFYADLRPLVRRSHPADPDS